MNVATDLPWPDILAGGTAAGVATLLGIYFSKQSQKQAETFASSNEKNVQTFASTAKDITEKFSETTTTLLREQREEGSQREERLIDTLKEFRKP